MTTTLDDVAAAVEALAALPRFTRDGVARALGVALAPTGREHPTLDSFEVAPAAGAFGLVEYAETRPGAKAPMRRVVLALRPGPFLPQSAFDQRFPGGRVVHATPHGGGLVTTRRPLGGRALMAAFAGLDRQLSHVSITEEGGPP